MLQSWFLELRLGFSRQREPSGEAQDPSNEGAFADLRQGLIPAC